MDNFEEVHIFPNPMALLGAAHRRHGATYDTAAL